MIVDVPIAIGRFITRVAAGLRQDGFERRVSDLLYQDSAGGVAVINFQRVTGWGAPLTFHVNAATSPPVYYDFRDLTRSEAVDAARGGFGLWRARVSPTPAAVARFRPGLALSDMWACHDESEVIEAAAQFVAEARETVIPTLVGLLDPVVCAEAVRHRVRGNYADDASPAGRGSDGARYRASRNA